MYLRWQKEEKECAWIHLCDKVLGVATGAEQTKQHRYG